MSAEMLRKAAEHIRVDQEGEFLLGHIDSSEHATWLAVADWLDFTASLNETVGKYIPDAALAVARAYLGEQPC